MALHRPLKALGLSTLLAFGALAAFAPTAQAHACSADDPQDSCGECYGGNHDHFYSDGSLYCRSTYCSTTVHGLIDCVHETAQDLIDDGQQAIRDLIGTRVRFPFEVAVKGSAVGVEAFA